MRSCKECGKDLGTADFKYCFYCRQRLTIEKFSKQDSPGWPHKYFEWELNGERICQPFININCVRITDDSFWVVAKYGTNNSDLLAQENVPGQLEAYLEWVDEVNK